MFYRLIFLSLLTLFSAADCFAEQALTAYQLHKTERILTEQLSCLGCHRLGNKGGMIAPDLLKTRERLSRQQVARIISDPQSELPGSIMPRVSLRPGMLESLVEFLFQHQKSQHPEPGPIRLPARASLSEAENGKALFQHYCSACHGAEGRGNGFNASMLNPPPTDLTDANRLKQRPDDTLFDIIARGGRFFDLNPRMPPWGKTLQGTQIRALVAHIRELCTCNGPDWSLDGMKR